MSRKAQVELDRNISLVYVRSHKTLRSPNPTLYRQVTALSPTLAGHRKFILWKKQLEEVQAPNPNTPTHLLWIQPLDMGSCFLPLNSLSMTDENVYSIEGIKVL